MRDGHTGVLDCTSADDVPDSLMKTYRSRLLKTTDNQNVSLPETASNWDQRLFSLDWVYEGSPPYALQAFTLGGRRYEFQHQSARLPAFVYAAVDQQSYAVYMRRGDVWVMFDDLQPLNAAISTGNPSRLFARVASARQ